VHSGAAKKRRGLFHAMDQLALTKPITKWNGCAETPEQIPQRIAEAFQALSKGRPGAGLLEVPLDMLQQELEFDGLKLDLQNMEKSISPLSSMADAALAVGFRFSQLATINYTLPVPKSLVQIDVDSAEIGAYYPVKAGIASDAKTALRQLRDALLAEGLR